MNSLREIQNIIRNNNIEQIQNNYYKNKEVWDDGEVPWILKDDPNANNSNSNEPGNKTQIKSFPIIPMALVIRE